MAWSTDPQEPERIPRAGWYATPTVLQPPAWAEWYDPYQERAGNDSGVGTLTATVKQIERVTANFGGAGAFTPGASSTTQYVAAAFDNYDTSATGYLYSGLSAWGWAVRTVAAALSGLGTTWVTTGDHVDGLSATTAEQYLGQPGIAQPSIGTLIGSVFQKYPAAGSFSSSSALSGEVHTLGGFPDGLSAYAFPESDVIGFEDSEGQLDGVIYQIYTGVAPPFASQGALTASVVPRRDSTPALTGFGILTLTTVMQMVRTAALSNIGTLAATTSQIYTLPTVTLAGTGSLSGQQVQGYTTAVQLTGTGNLSGQTQQGYAVAGNFTGFGTLIPQRNSSLTLTGTGALAATVVAQYPCATALTGAGALTSTSRMYQIGSAAALSASGALTATRTSQYYEVRSVALSGGGSLSAVASPVAQRANITIDPGFESSGNSTAYARNGTKSSVLVADGIGWQSTWLSSGWVECTPGQVIYGEVWFLGKPTNVQSGLDAVGITLAVQDTTGVNPISYPGASFVTSPGTTNGVWNKIAYTLTVPAGYNQYIPYFWVHINATAGDTYYFDDPIVRPSNLFQGGGSLTATVVGQRNAAPALSGAGALSGTTTSQYNASVALTGSGALAATYTSQYYAQTAASLTGSGTLSATAVAQYLTNPSFGGGGTLSATAVDNWTPYNEENVAVTGGTVPSGASGCYVTIIGGGGGGGKANAKSTSPYTDYGGGGGGGGGKVARVWIPKASLGATYTVEVGGGGAGGFTPANGTRSYFTSGSVTLTANGGTKGANATTSAAGSAGGGGTASASGVTATTYNGASGSNGSSGTAIAGSASANAGAGGGGGGGGTNTLYFSGGAGGSANGGAIAGGTANGGTPSDAAAGIGGAGGGGGGTNGNGLGGNGGKYGGGAGGGGHGTTGRGGTGGAGYTKVEWV